MPSSNQQQELTVSRKRYSGSSAFVGRGVCIILLLVSLGSSTGCQLFNTNKIKLEPAPEVFQNVPAQNDLMSLVNRRSQAVRELQAQVSVTLSDVPTRLNGSLIVQRPKNLRLKIGPMGMDSLGADVGSNAEEFWVWIKSAGIGGDPTLLHARHQEFAHSSNADQIPMDPKWLFDSLGLVSFESGKNYHGPTVRPDGRLVVYEIVPTAKGQQIAEMIFDPKTGVLVQKSLYDASRNLIGYCDLTNHQYFPSLEVAIPTKVKITFRPGTSLQSVAEIQLSNLQLNGLYVDQVSAWQMPNPIGVRKVDLARATLTPAQLTIQPVGYQTPPESNLSTPFRGALLNKMLGR